MRHPTIHLNGTHPKDLYEQLSRAIDALREAESKLAEAYPNGRDYYVQGPGAIVEAADEHRARLLKLASVREELEQLIEPIADRL